MTTALIVVFGEIIPQSVCSRYALRIGAMSVPVVWLFVAGCYVAAWPIAKILDWVLGGEMSAVYTKAELKSLILLNVENPQRQEKSGMTSDDGKMLAGALTFRDKTASDVMTPMDSTFVLCEDAILTTETVAEILRSGHTRIPVTRREDPTDVVALLYAKDLVGIGFERRLPVTRVLAGFKASDRVHAVASTTNLGACFELCKKERCHMLIVVDKTKRLWPALGILTTEDVLEEIIQDEIVGDDDQFVDDAAASSSRPGILRKNSRAYDPTVLLKELTAETNAASAASGEARAHEGGYCFAPGIFSADAL